MSLKILLVGSGKMGGAMLDGWLNNGIEKTGIYIVDPFEERAKELGVNVVKGADEVDGDYQPDIVVFAIKPQIMADVVPDYQKYKGATFLSIMAGQTIEALNEALGGDAAVVRAMPNLPAMISRGVTVAVANDRVGEEAKEQCTSLLSAIGNVHWADEESLMDAVTAISGSGPAYIFHFIESFIDAGVKLGLPDELAKSLAYDTVLGSAVMASESKDSATTLRENVTSPGGTTAAALEVLMGDDAMQELMQKATKAANDRSIELNKK